MDGISTINNDPEWEDMIAEFGEFYALSNDEKLKESDNKLHDGLFHWPMFSAASKAWNLLLDSELSYTPLPIKENKLTSWQEISEIPWMTTNTISQWSLNLIVCMELINEFLPKKRLQESVNV